MGLNEEMKYYEFDNDAHWGIANAGKWQMRYEHLKDIVESDDKVPNKVRELIAFKSTIMFELIDCETSYIYRKIHEQTMSLPKANKSKKQEKETPTPINFQLSESIKIALEDTSQHTADSSLVSNRLAWHRLLEATEFAIYDLTVNGKASSKAVDLREEINTLSSPQLALLFTLLKNNKIIVENNTKISSAINQLTGYSPSQLRKHFSKYLSNNADNSFTQTDYIEVKNVLSVMLQQLNALIKND